MMTDVLFCVAVLLAAGGATADEPLTWQRVDAAEKEAVDLRREVRRLQLAAEDDEKRISMYRTQIDLLTDRRADIPRTTVAERLVKRLFAEERFVLDNRADGAPLVDRRFLDVPAGRKYRLRFAVRLDELKGSWGVKCGCLVTVRNGGHRWKSAMIGCQPFGWRDISLDVEVPGESTLDFSLGFGSGKGRLEWSDLRIYELTEETK